MTHRLLLSALLALLLCSASFADLHDPANSADYLIITPANVIQSNPWIAQLADWRNAHGRTAMIVPTDSIWAEFGSASDTTLKDFFWYAYRHWSAPQLKDVFIIGWHNVVPSHVELDSFPNEPLDYVSDYFFATDPDSAGHVPVLNVGRLPWNPATGPLWNYYAKVVAYETADAAPWQTRVHLIADSADPRIGDFADIAEPLLARVHAGYSIERDYIRYPPGDPWHGDRSEILSNFTAGSYLSAYLGLTTCLEDTCTRLAWSNSLQLDSTDFAGLQNGERLPIVVGMGGEISRNTFELRGIPTAFLSNPSGGAIGFIGWTIGWAYTGVQFKRVLFGRATSDSVAVLGDMWRITGEAFYRASAYNFDQNYPVKQTLFSCMLMGDPGLRLPARPSTVTDIPASAPTEFKLVGNYPNPFNPSTQIQFELARAAQVKLQVMNVLGQHVATLLDAPREAGTYAVRWDGMDFPSGLYFAVLQSASERHTIKMMLLK